MIDKKNKIINWVGSNEGLRFSTLDRHIEAKDWIKETACFYGNVEVLDTIAFVDDRGVVNVWHKLIPEVPPILRLPGIPRIPRPKERRHSIEEIVARGRKRCGIKVGNFRG